MLNVVDVVTSCWYLLVVVFSCYCCSCCGRCLLAYCLLLFYSVIPPHIWSTVCLEKCQKYTGINNIIIADWLIDINIKQIPILSWFNGITEWPTDDVTELHIDTKASRPGQTVICDWVNWSTYGSSTEWSEPDYVFDLGELIQILIHSWVQWVNYESIAECSELSR